MMSTVDRIAKEDFCKTLRRFGIMEEPELNFNGAALTADFIKEMNKVIYEGHGTPNTNTMMVSPQVWKGLTEQLKDDK